MSGYNEIWCVDCNEVLGWATSCGPGPLYLCNSCKEKEDQEAE